MSSLSLSVRVLLVLVFGPLLLWWLVLFIEALVLSPNFERDGIPQWPNAKGDN